MIRTLTLAIVLALGASSASAAAVRCKDPVTHRFIKCAVVEKPAVVVEKPSGAVVVKPARTAVKPVARPMAGGPHCVKGKRCGNACISVKLICHKP